MLGQSGGSLSNPELPLEQAGPGHFSALSALTAPLHCSNTCSETPAETPQPCSRLWFRTCSEHPEQCLLMLVSAFPSLPVHSEVGHDHLLPAPSHNLPVSFNATPDAYWHSSSYHLSQHKGCSQRFVIPTTISPPCFHRKGSPQMFFTPTAMG